jgi:hypothetical protein
MIPFSLEVGPQNPFLLFLMREREREREKGGERRIGKFNTISYHVIHAIPNKARSFCAKQSWNFKFITTRNRDPNFGKYQISRRFWRPKF